MFDSASPADILAFVSRIDATVLAGRTPREAWIELMKKNGGGSGSLNDMEDNWLNARLANTRGKGKDKADNYLNSKGYTGSCNDKLRNYLRTSAVQ